MNHSDIAALMKGAAPVIADLLAKAVRPLSDRIAELESELEAVRAVDHAASLAELVDEAVRSLPPAQKGDDADPAETRRMVNEAVAAAIQQLPPAEPGEPGADVDMAEVDRMISAKVQDAVSALPPAEPGRSVSVDDVAPMLRDLVEQAVGNLPPAEPGKSIEPADVEPMLAQMVERAVVAIPPAEPGRSVTVEEIMPLLRELVEQLPPAEPGKSVELTDVEPVLSRMVQEAVSALPPAQPGAPGKLPTVKAWEDRVYYEGECCISDGSTFQANKDTGRAPGHEDWTCIAKGGQNGSDGRSLRVRGTYEAAGEYLALDLVALNGGSFVARKDDPGHCPGEGWQMVAARGKRGEPGESVKGEPGKTVKGDPGEPVISAEVSDEGLLTLVNGDGSTIECDLYPLLRKVSGAGDV